MNAPKRDAAFRTRLREHLAAEDYGAIVELHEAGEKPLRRLLPLTYDKATTQCWRAIRAIALISARMELNDARELVQKLLWMMREESGGNPWSAPELLGEILCENPGRLPDIRAVLISFHDEVFFRAGVLWAMYRMAGAGLDGTEAFTPVALRYLSDDTPAVRAYAALFLRAFSVRAEGPGDLRDALNALAKDTAPVPFFDGHELIIKTVGELAGP